MDKKTHDKGLEIRKAVLGEAYVANALKNADDFNKPFQELVTEYCWGAVWGREELPRKTRSMLNLAMISILNRPHELRVHIKGALVNGVTKDEIREIFMQVAIYAGVPAGVDSFRIAREVFAEIDKGSDSVGTSSRGFKPSLRANGSRECAPDDWLPRSNPD
jgi:4-carboxymuconolactone decarboxylase